MDIVRDQEKKGLLLGKTFPQHPHPVIIVPRAALRGVAQERVVTQSQEIKRTAVFLPRDAENDFSQVQDQAFQLQTKTEQAHFSLSFTLLLPLLLLSRFSHV